MATKTIKSKSFKGISLLVALRISKEIDASHSKVLLFKDGESVDASNVLDVLALGADENSNIKVIVYGKDEEKVIQQVTEILIDGAGI